MSPVAASVLFFLGVSLLLYVLLAGADFGAGILEIFLGRGGRARREDQIRLISHAMAPVWEANHVWLILAVVILFVGFPSVYTSLSVYLHIPVLAILLGIVGRGCAFTFRHYDTLNRDFHRFYSVVFAGSSLWTSFFLGVVAGAAILGHIDPGAVDFPGLYVAPWLNGFCVAMGIFTSSLFAFLAAVYLVGEAPPEKDPELRELFRRKARYAAAAVVLSGFLVFVLAELEGLPLARRFFADPVSLGAFALATALWMPFWSSLNNAGRSARARALAATIVAAVIFGWYWVQYPVAVRLAGGSAGLTFPEAAAPEPVLKAMLLALVVGSLLIFPALGYLLKVFKWETFEKGR